jgi:hypothetical protein
MKHLAIDRSCSPVALAAGWICLLLLLLISQATFAATWEISVNEKDGLPVVSRGGQTVMSSRFAFWGANWSWAGQPAAFRIVAPLEYAVSGTNRQLGFRLNASASSPAPGTMSWEFTLAAPREVKPAIGGGIAFNFPIDSSRSSSEEPQLLPGNRGWQWRTRQGDTMTMSFDPPLPKLTLERKRTVEIRGFFYADVIPEGERRYRATLSIKGDAEVRATTTEKFGIADHRQWPDDLIDLQVAPVDLSFLNADERPAGKRGFIRADGDRLVFEDGTVARFWGTNLTAAALFQTSRDGVRAQAKRLAALGFNLVRFHHHDSHWVNPNIFGPRGRPDTLSLNERSLAQLDWWIHCLKAEGIYVWLDLHVGRQLRPTDRISGFDEISRGKPSASLKGFNYVNADIQTAMRRFNEDYVNRVNVHTGIPYKAEPAIIAMLITNENDLTTHFGNALLPNKNVPLHNRIYMEAARTFADQHDLPRDRVWRSWEHGPSKLFLNDLEHRFNQMMIGHLRSLGVRAPLVTTSTWGRNPVSALPALTAGDIVDVHAYGSTGELKRNPVRRDTLVHWLAAGQVAGKPLSVTEWNLGSFPSPDRHSLPLQVAASAALQGWDASMQYAYAQVPLDRSSKPSNWHTFNDPSMLGTLPAAALLYRRSDVTESRSVYAFAPGSTEFFNRQTSPATAVALRTAAERGRLVIELPKTAALPWLRPATAPSGAERFTEPGKSFIAADATRITSDNGELMRDWRQGIYTINTARTQAATGWIGGQEIRLDDVDVVISTRYASIAVQSLEDRAIAESEQLLISMAARALHHGGRKGRFHAEPVVGEISIRAPAGLRLYALGGRTSSREREVPVRHEDGRYHVVLDERLRSYWLMLKKPG